jgi:hypothetical protein
LRKLYTSAARRTAPAAEGSGQTPAVSKTPAAGKKVAPKTPGAKPVATRAQP